MHHVAETPLAIVGMSCRVPGADGLDAYWRLLVEARSELGDLPPDRFDRSLYYDPKKGVHTKSYTTLGGFVPHNPFDLVNCPTPGEVFGRTHPVHLNLVEVACAAARHAGYDPFRMPQVTTGVYVGHTPPTSLASRLIHARLVGHTAWFLKNLPAFDALVGGRGEAIINELIDRFRGEFPDRTHPATTLNANAYHASSVISQALRLDGPSMSYDAACASSLRALAHAARALQLGQIDMAVVGGASYTTVDTLILFSQAQSLTANKSRPFDAEADGLVASEAYAVVLVKTLERALADGDRIQAVIRGIGISSDGKGKSLWAPRREGQIEAVRRAYPQGFSPARLQFLEAHATSTQLGDATELGALHTALGDQLLPGRKLFVGSVKGNIGHSLETAGLASIVKTVLAMQHETIPPQCGLNTLNPDVPWDQVPFEIPRVPTTWPDPANGDPKCAAVNAFGIGGLNVHVVLEEHTPENSASLVKSHRGTATPLRLVAKEGPAPLADGIAIVGIGAVLPGARTAEALWDLFRSGRDMRTEASDSRWCGGPDKSLGRDSHWHAPHRRAGFITDFEYDWKKHKVPPRQVQYADPLQFMLLDATDQALKDAGYDKKPLDRMRTGVLVGTVFGGEFADILQSGLRLSEFQKALRDVMRREGVSDEDAEKLSDQFEDELLKHMPALIDETGSFTASTLASRLTKTFDLMGGAVAVDAGDVSSAAALSNCADLLLAGDCDVMICASGQRNCGYAWFLSMDRNGLLARDGMTAPFDEASDGSVPAEGVGVLVLKRLSDARRDGDRIHGIVRGIGGGYRTNLKESITLAMRRGLQSAAIAPDQVSVIEAGAAGIARIDRKELQAVVDVYGTTTRNSELLIGAVAGQIGHACGASGMMSVLRAVTELEHVEMPKNVGLTKPSPELAKAADTLRPVLEPEKLRGINDDGRMFAAVDSYSTSNGAFHLILESPAPVPKDTTPRKRAPAARRIAAPERPILAANAAGWRIVRRSAESLDELVKSLAAHAELPACENEYVHGTSVESLCGPASSSAAGPPLDGYDPSHRCRLAIVARSAQELSELTSLAVKQLAKPEARGALAEKGIHYAETGAVRPRVAFLFPGQGSQYAGMLKTLVESFGPAADALDEVDAVLSRLALPSFADIAWKDGDQLGADVARTQLSLLAADTIVYRAARALGLRPERLAGHSFGELAALTAAGAWTFEDALRATSARCAAIESCRNAKGALLSTSASSDVAEKTCREVGGEQIGSRVFVSHRNAPDQSVVGGDPAAVERVSQALGAAGYRTKILDVPAAFHTPLMEEVKAPFGRSLAAIPMEPPAIPVLSSVTNKYAADPADIRENLVVQMTQPVHWVELVRRLHAEGFNLLVEVGPKQVLTGLQKQILAGSDATIVGCDHPKRDGLQQLLNARAAVEVTGALDSTAACGLAAGAKTANPQAIKTAKPQADDALPLSPNGVELHGEARILRLAGTPYEMGLQHGRAEAENIRRVLRRYADLAGTKWDKLHNVDDAVSRAEAYFGPDELEELRGVADGAEVALPAIIAHNLRLHLDVGSGGLHFAVRGANNAGVGLLHGVNEDLQRALSVRDCLARHVQVRTPAAGNAHVAFCVAGQVGTLNGINAAGLAVSTSALVDVSLNSDAAGPLHTVLVKNLLEQSADVDAAILSLRQRKSAGAWTLCLSHVATDRLCYVEFDGRELKVQQSADAVSAANHRLMKVHLAAEGNQAAGAPPHSKHRLDRLRQLLGGSPAGPISVEKAQSVLRDRFDPSRGRESEYPTINTVRRVDNQISILMQPSQRRVYVTAGPLSNGHQNEFQCLDLSRLLPEFGKSAPPQAAVEKPARAGAPHPSVISRHGLKAAYESASRDRDGATDVCTRSIVRITPSPLPESNAPAAFRGAVAVLGANAAADAIATALRQFGADVVAIRPAANSTSDSLSAELEQGAVSRPIAHLVIATPFDADARTTFEPASWSGRRERGVLTPFFVAQKWLQKVVEANLLDEATVTAVTAMGGDFGIAGRFAGVESGALSGLVKGLEMEVRMSRGAPKFRGRVIDFAADSKAADVAAAVVRELIAGDDENEIGYVEGRRYAARPVPQSSPVAPRQESRARSERGGTTDVPRATGSPVAERQGDFPKNAVFVVTGGARGVTAVVARELGKRFGARLHLLGASPLPEIPEAWRNLADADVKDVKATIMKEALANGQKPADAWGRFEKSLEIDRTLRSFAEAGVRATYHACDVGSRETLAKTLDTIRRIEGPIQGVIHGAGFERACKFEKKQRELVDKTIAAKVDGAVNLMELTKNDPVKWFAGFGSVSGRFGGVGQADYCVANEMLAKLIDWHRTHRPDCGAAVFHWHAWDDVGMAVRPESQHIRKLHKINFMPSLEGARHLLDELAAGLPEPEVVITELDYSLQRYAASLDADAEPADSSASTAEPARKLALVDRVVVQTPGERLTTEIDLDPSRDVFLTQHLFKKRPMMPVVASIEAVVEAATQLAKDGERPASISGVEILTGLRFLTDSVQTARVQAHRQGNRVACSLGSDLTNRRGQVLQKDKPYLRGTVELTKSPAPFRDRLPDTSGEWNAVWYPETDAVIWHGQPFRCLQEMVVLDERRSGGLLIAPDPGVLSAEHRGREWIIPASLLDSCLYACGVIFWYRHRGVVAIPDRIESIRFGSMPAAGERCQVILTDNGRQGSTASFDFTLFRADGSVALAVEGYRNVIVAEEPAHAV